MPRAKAEPAAKASKKRAPARAATSRDRAADPATPVERSSVPAKRSTTPTKRAVAPAKRPAASGKRSGAPAKRPAASAERSAAPAKRSGTPTKPADAAPKRPATSAKRPATSTKRAAAPAHRSAAPSERPAAASKRPAGHSIDTYRARRNFAVTAEPAPRYPKPSAGDPMFVVQKHQAHRAGLHWDFRLEHGGVLWSWAVRKGPSLDPHDKRIAAHVEDHPIDYAEFQGRIPDGQYGAGTVETWDRGTWLPLGDPEAGRRDGEIKFVLDGQRLRGKFTLVRLRPRPNERRRQDNWLLIKGHDEEERAGADAPALEAAIPFHRAPTAETSDRAAGDPDDAAQPDADPDPAAPARGNSGKGASASEKGASASEKGASAPRRTRKASRKTAPADDPPAEGAKRGPLPESQAPQLAELSDTVPEGDEWLAEIKFDGYRLLLFVDSGTARVVTRNGHDWTDRLPAVARAAAALPVETALLDGELVALDAQGISSFPALQAALSAGRDDTLALYLFDLLHLDGWDLRPAPLTERKRVLATLDLGGDMLRYSDHHLGQAVEMRQAACRMKLEGIICKQAEAPYRAGRGHGWRKIKCQGREEFVVLGWTPPAGSRTGFGALHVGYWDAEGGLHYAGGVGTGFSDDELTRLSARLADLAADPPRGLLVAGDPLDSSIHWVRPELVIEVQFIAWTGAGRVRHAVYLGVREDKSAREVVRDVANPESPRQAIRPKPPRGGTRDKARPVIAVPPRRRRAEPSSRPAPAPEAATPPAPDATAPPAKSSRIVTARKPKARSVTLEGITISHPDRELWPGITKQALAEYWIAIADHALPGLAHRPLAVVRCPEGVAGEHFFQKHAHGSMPPGIREGSADGAPFLAIDDLAGLVAMAQVSAVELHAWGAAEADPLHPDQIVFDLDPGEGVPFTQVIEAAHDVRDRLERLGLTGFCRTTGGKGLHIVVPLAPKADWGVVKPFCRAFAETMGQDAPDRYLSTMKKADRLGRILVDWLRNGLGATAVASFCPRARPGAGVATPLAWDEVTRTLDPASLNLRTVPERLARQRIDPWQDFDKARQPLPVSSGTTEVASPKASAPARKARIVRAAAPKKR